MLVLALHSLTISYRQVRQPSPFYASDEFKPQTTTTPFARLSSNTQTRNKKLTYPPRSLPSHLHSLPHSTASSSLLSTQSPLPTCRALESTTLRELRGTGRHEGVEKVVGDGLVEVRVRRRRRGAVVFGGTCWRIDECEVGEREGRGRGGAKRSRVRGRNRTKSDASCIQSMKGGDLQLLVSRLSSTSVNLAGPSPAKPAFATALTHSPRASHAVRKNETYAVQRRLQSFQSPITSRSSSCSDASQVSRGRRCWRREGSSKEEKEKRRER